MSAYMASGEGRPQDAGGDARAGLESCGKDPCAPQATVLLVVSLAAALLAAAPAYPGAGISASGDAPMLFLSLSLGAMIAAAFFSREGPVLPGVPALGFLGGFMALAVLSTVLSDFVPFAYFGSPTTRLGLISLVPIGGLLVFARGFSREIGHLLRQTAPWVMGAWVLAMAYQEIAVDFKPWGLSSNNALSAQLLLLLLPVVIVRGGRDRWLRAGIGLAVAGVLWWASSAMGVALALAWTGADALLTRGYLKRLPAIARMSIPIAHAVLSALLVVAAISGLLSGSLLGGRTGIWHLALDTIASAPATGVGPDVLLHASPPLLSADSAQVAWDRPIISASAHSVWLDTLASFGGPMALLVLAGLVLLARRWSERVNSIGFPYVAGLLLYSLTLLVQPVGLQTLPILMLVIVASVPPAGRTSRTTAPLPIALGVVAALSACVLFAYAVTCLSVGRPEFHPGSRETAETAAGFWQYDPELWAQTAYRFGTEIGTTGDPAIQGMQEAFQRAIDLVPAEHQYRLDLAHSSELLGLDPAVVTMRYAAALAAFPLSPEGNYWSGLFSAAQGDAASAQKAYDVLKTYYPTWSGTVSFDGKCAELGVMVE